MCTTEDEEIQKEGNITTYFQVVSNLLSKLATDDVIVETEDDSSDFN